MIRFPLRALACAIALSSVFATASARVARADDDGPDFPPFDKQVKDMELTAGYWDVYYKAKDQSLLGVIPSGELEKPFLLTSSISGGTPYAGWQWTDTLVAWERIGKKLALVEKNVHYRADPEKPIADAVVRTYCGPRDPLPADPRRGRQGPARSTCASCSSSGRASCSEGSRSTRPSEK